MSYIQTLGQNILAYTLKGARIGLISLIFRQAGTASFLWILQYKHMWTHQFQMIEQELRNLNKPNGSTNEVWSFLEWLFDLMC